MRPMRILLYALAAVVGLYVLAVVLYAIPMVGGLIDDTMEVSSIVPTRRLSPTTAMGSTPHRGRASTTSRKVRRSCRGSC